MTRRRWLDLGAIALTVMVAVGIVVASWSGGAAGSVATPPNPAPLPRGTADAKPLTLFIGDSYTAGESTAEMSYGCRVAVQLDSLCALSAMAGTGFISGGSANRWVDPYVGKSLSFSERIPHLAAKYDPTVVVLDGGRNDVFAPRKFVYAEMLRAIAAVHRTWPSAEIVFIRPRFLDDPGNDLGFDDAFMKQLESEPATRGVTFIDPIKSFAGTDTAPLLGPDGLHPNHLGYERLTEALAKSLAAAALGWA